MSGTQFKGSEGDSGPGLRNPEAIFHAALDIEETQQRAAFLENACHKNPSLRKQVERLLRADTGANDFFKEFDSSVLGPIDSRSSEYSGLDAGKKVGAYELIEKLGEGGFGAVYLARQTTPVRRDVALKILRVGMDSAEVVRRFELERQALALMTHPGIAAVYDAGRTENGRPFFVMELAVGEPIVRYADRHLLALKERLELFIQVCRAVQHAHQKGVIHRDLKPSNILVCMVDGKPSPKIIDFGIAKATAATISEATMITRAHELVGTPAYMSPEQAGRSDVDTRSDVYALGIVLYELLTGQPPLRPERLQTSSLEAVVRFICEEEAPAPSQRLRSLSEEELRTVAALRQSHARDWIRRVQGELDWIVLKAIEKDRQRRYPSAIALAEDIERFLRHEPVTAAAPSAFYQMRKLARRYRTAVAVASAITVMLLLGAGVSSWLAWRAMKAERRRALEAENAKRQANLAEATRKFLTEDVLGAADPMRVNRINMTMREALDQAAAKLGRQYQNEPLIEADIRATLCRIYSNMGEHERALPHAVRTLELRERTLGVTERETLRAKRSLALELLALRGREPSHFDRAIALLREAQRTAAATLPKGDEVAVDITAALASALYDRQEFTESAQLAREAITSWTNRQGLYNPRAANMLANFAGNYATFPQKDKAEEQKLFELAYEVSRKVFGPANPNNVQRLINLAAFYLDSGQVSQAETRSQEAVELARKALGPTHPWTWAALRISMRARLKQGNPHAAQLLAEEEIQDRFRIHSATDASDIDAITEMGNEFENAGANEAAIAGYRKGVERLAGARPKELSSLVNVTYWHVALTDYSEALDCLNLIQINLQKSGYSIDSSLACRRALMACMARKLDEYVAIRKQLLDEFGQTDSANTALVICRASLALPPRSNDTERLRHLVDVIRTGRQSSAAQAWTGLTLGLAAFRSGDLHEASSNLLRVVDGPAVCQASARLLLAMIHQQQNDHAAASEQFLMARRCVENEKRSKYSWWDEYLFYRIILEEASKVVQPVAAPGV